MSANMLPQRFQFGPQDTLGTTIYYRYYPYQATLARWDRASAEAARNPYEQRLTMLQAQLDTERAELMQMMRALSAGPTALEIQQEAAARAATAAAGRRRGGGGGRGTDRLEDLLKGTRITQSTAGTLLEAPTEDLRAALRAGGGGPDLVPRVGIDANMRAAQALSVRPQSADMVAAAIRSEPGFQALIQDPQQRRAAAADLAARTDNLGLVAALYGADALTTGPGAQGTPALGVAPESETALNQYIVAETEKELRRREAARAAGAGGGGGGGAATQAVDPNTVLSEAERLAVQRYIDTLADDGVPTEEEYGEGFEAGKAAYEKAANLGLYTRAQAPYFNNEFLKRLGSVAKLKAEEGETRQQFLEREERTPAEIEREQARLFLESEARAQGLMFLDPREYPDKPQWWLDTVPRAMRIVRDEGVDALLEPVTDAQSAQQQRRPGFTQDPAEYGRTLAMTTNIGGTEARALAQKKFKNDERADVALDYFYATRGAQNRRATMTQAQLKQEAAQAKQAPPPTPAAPAPAPSPAAPTPAAPPAAPEASPGLYPPPGTVAPTTDGDDLESIVFQNIPPEVVLEPSTSAPRTYNNPTWDAIEQMVNIRKAVEGPPYRMTDEELDEILLEARAKMTPPAPPPPLPTFRPATVPR
jgi:hypothetical protein